MSSEVAEAPLERRCRARTRPRPDGALRPTDVVGAFFIGGIAMLVAGALAGTFNALDPWPWGRWLALHLSFVGGVSQLILGASQFFVGAFLATDPPSRGLIRAQLASWNAGSLLLAVAVPLGSSPLIWLAVAVLLAGLVLYVRGLNGMQRRSLQIAPWAARWYFAAAGLLAVGIFGGALLSAGVAWTYGNLLAAHMALNVAGWFGAAIVGTLHTFYPSLTKTNVAFPRLQPPAFGAWIAGVVALAGGYGWSVDPLAVAGWIALTVAAALLVVNVGASLGRAPRPLSLPARALALAQLFLLAGLLTATVGAVGSGPAEALSGSSRAAVGTLLVGGWVGITVLGSLLHLLAVVVRVRDLSRSMPVPRPRFDLLVSLVTVVGVVGLGATQLAELDGLRGVASAVLVGAYALLGSQVLTLAFRVLAVARPRV